jgi:hypothetical protein
MSARMLTRNALFAMLGAGLLASAAPSAAHHAFSTEFDANQPITLRGTIARVEWINPHAWIHLDVKNESGTVESWMIEAGSPNTLVRRGLTRESIPAGTEVIVFGYRHRNGSNKANGRDVTLPDGRRLFITSPGTGAPGGD